MIYIYYCNLCAFRKQGAEKFHKKKISSESNWRFDIGDQYIDYRTRLHSLNMEGLEFRRYFSLNAKGWMGKPKLWLSRFKKSPSLKKSNSSIEKASESSSPISINDSIKDLPGTSGIGAFVSPVIFQVMGSTCNLLNIKIPKSSILNIRYNDYHQKVIALNGKIENMSIELGKVQSKDKTDLLLYQRCFNPTTPMSMILSLNSQNANFTILHNDKAKDSSKWIVKREDLVAWSGRHLDVFLSPEYSQLAQLAGTGSLVLSSPGQISKIHIDDGESISLNPRCIVAYTTPNEMSVIDATKELGTGLKRTINMSIPKVGIMSWLDYFGNATKRTIKNMVSVSAKYLHGTSNDSSTQIREETPQMEKLKEMGLADEPIKVKAESKEKHETVSKFNDKTRYYLTKCWTFVVNTTRKMTSSIIFFLGRLTSGSKQSYMITLKGPKTILINNSVSIRSKILTKKEIDRLTL